MELESGLGSQILCHGKAIKEYNVESSLANAECPKLECFVQSIAACQFEVEIFRDNTDDFLCAYVHADGLYQDNVILSRWIEKESVQGQRKGNRLYRFRFQAIRLTEDEEVYSQFESEKVMRALGSVEVSVYKWSLRDVHMESQGANTDTTPLASTSDYQFNEASAKAAMSHTAGISADDYEECTTYNADGWKTGPACGVQVQIPIRGCST